ncbi:hypothetical protein KIPE111705_36980 [Kibdelosporangium persicum]|uniref:Uncharacterized protein n=2 Tax=Kibdelosporangium persicum TaxID=2698649 RepID=A0ABX2F3L6_9PSEU|nr:hypothetical protein [Kibdelosporangium persicum]
MAMPIWQTVITVVSTLVATVTGAVVGSVLKSRADSAGRVHEWQVTVVEIYGDLMTALSNHYAAMWDLEAARIRNNAMQIESTLAATLATRSAVTRPHTQLAVLAPLLRPHVDRAVQAVYAMDTALEDQASRTEERLTASRHAAKAAMKALETEMAAVMAGLGAGLPGR